MAFRIDSHIHGLAGEVLLALSCALVELVALQEVLLHGLVQRLGHLDAKVVLQHPNHGYPQCFVLDDLIVPDNIAWRPLLQTYDTDDVSVFNWRIF